MDTSLGSSRIQVVGAGLAGCEAAYMLAKMNVAVELIEMKPAQYSPAHSLPGPAELVCSNSLKSEDPQTAHGLLKAELRDLGSVLMRAADSARVRAGSALAVERSEFSQAVRAALLALPDLTYREGVRVDKPADHTQVILATGPLTEGGLIDWLSARMPRGDYLYFYDALAPIVANDSLDHSQLFYASRWGKGEKDYLNCPLSQQQYQDFVAALKSAQQSPLHEFEDSRFFESCLPIETIAQRGEQALAFGPLRPVGLERNGKRFHAVVQLRPENKQHSAFNLVGFQTKLTQQAQRKVFRMLPGLEQATFLRYGAVHRNLFVNSPEVLDAGLRLHTAKHVRLAGQITGVEGYVESAAIGLLVGLMVACEQREIPFVAPPLETALGALLGHIRNVHGQETFEPMNIHFGLLPAQKARGRKLRRHKAVETARKAFAAWLDTVPKQALVGG